IYVLDAEGRIRFKDARGEALTKAVATLLAELDTPTEQAHTAGKPVGAAPTIGGASGRGIAAEVTADLVAKHAAADAAWNEAWRQLKGKERTALRKQDPARDFLAEFEALAKIGDPTAKLWLVEHLKVASDLRSKELKARVSGLFTELVADPGGLTAEVARALLKETRLVEREQRLDLLAQLSKRSIERNLAAELLAERAEALGGRRATPDELARAEALWDRLLADYLDTPEGVSAWGRRNAGAFEGVGSMAVDFPAIDTEGKAFRLSDYRGEVVLLDFWGFW
ncbi:MAG: hypothetical protein P1V81_14600, partial [Planctomycetota bacterium]|nr:hypothetical protein [Planctomycetota bacterium]